MNKYTETEGLPTQKSASTCLPDYFHSKTRDPQ